MAIKFKKITGEHLATNYGSGRLTPPKLRWFLLVLLISLPLLFLIGKLIKEYVFVSFSGLVVFDTFTIRAPDAGYIESLTVRTGQQINSGAPLLHFKSPTLELKLQYLQKERLLLKSLIQQFSLENYKPFDTMLTIASQDIQTSREVYERFKNYMKNGDMSELQLEEARKNFVSAQRVFSNLQKEIIDIKLRNKTTLEVSYQRKLREIDSKIKQLEEKQKYFMIRANKAGTIMQINTYNNEFVASGQRLLSIVTKENLRIMAFIEPQYLDKIYLGKKVSITFPDGESVPGKIVNTPRYAEMLPLSEINPMATRQNKLIAIIEPLTAIPKEYQVFGIPVKVRLK
ncbi:HlyD family secretion protein [Legionella hackeliae]|uniref:Putative coiled-coil protein n=1 Tax=Legionella hackeliae TaxID=449 RepID=A0A0A8USN8_LEGHA|nr:efflux RND transporter periplasmic adaptor subunit [Legionella hackeliae]KTD13820.1 coiled-coil protein [Legionella hackeliae]CEK10521.1 putative coiled-coil protein [Legionella hackeliae]STX47258.1 coiled-coil protein [Legionella hackeliae]